MLNVFILAGGEGTRLLGDEYPKALIRLVLPPVLEILTDDVLSFGCDVRICVITKLKWKDFFERWETGYKKGNRGQTTIF